MVHKGSGAAPLKVLPAPFCAAVLGANLVTETLFLARGVSGSRDLLRSILIRAF